jgi:transposase
MPNWKKKDSLPNDNKHSLTCRTVHRLRLPPYHPALNSIEKACGIMKTRIAAKHVTFKLRDVQQLAEQNVAAVTMQEWAAVCRHVNAVEDYMSREHEMDSVMERIMINADVEVDDRIFS